MNTDRMTATEAAVFWKSVGEAMGDPEAEAVAMLAALRLLEETQVGLPGPSARQGVTPTATVEGPLATGPSTARTGSPSETPTVTQAELRLAVAALNDQSHALYEWVHTLEAAMRGLAARVVALERLEAARIHAAREVLP